MLYNDAIGGFIHYPMKTNEIKRLTKDDLLFHEGLSLLVLMTGSLVISFLFNATSSPIAEGASVEYVKAPWIFVGVQYLLRSAPILISGVLVPLAVILLLALVPIIGSPQAKTTMRRAAPLILFFTTMAAVLVLTAVGYFSFS